MERDQEDNTVFVLQKAIHKFKIKVTDTSISEFLLAHPYYPSLKSVCDALNKWGIEHYALRLEIDEIRELELPFIAHLTVSGGTLVFVEKIENDNVFYSPAEGKHQHEPFVKFAEKLSGAVIVMEAGKNSGEKGYSKIRQNEILNKILLPIGVFTILIFISFKVSLNNWWIDTQQSLVFWGLLLTKITGLTASLFLLLHEFKVHSPLADKICGFSSKIDCDSVLTSNASRIFGWTNWADAGFIYFIGTFIYLLGSVGNSSFGILAIISLFSLPYTVFSIYYQLVKLKKWCPFCMLVQFVLISEFLILILTFKKIESPGADIIWLITSFSLPACLWIIFKAYQIKLNEQKHEHYLFLQLKRNPKMFLFFLESNGYTDITLCEDSLVLGNADAPIILTAFLSLSCSPCAKVFKELKTLLDTQSQHIKLNLVFLIKKEKEKVILNTLYFLKAEKGTEAILEFLDKWYAQPKQSLKDHCLNDLIPDYYDVVQQIVDKNRLLFDKHMIKGTPTIYVNGYLFPEQYRYNELEYYIEDIIQLSWKNERQEACIISI